MAHVFPESCGFQNAAPNFEPNLWVMGCANQLSATWYDRSRSFLTRQKGDGLDACLEVEISRKTNLKSARWLRWNMMKHRLTHRESIAKGCQVLVRVYLKCRRSTGLILHRFLFIIFQFCWCKIICEILPRHLYDPATKPISMGKPVKTGPNF